MTNVPASMAQPTIDSPRRLSGVGSDRAAAIRRAARPPCEWRGTRRVRKGPSRRRSGRRRTDPSTATVPARQQRRPGRTRGRASKGVSIGLWDSPSPGEKALHSRTWPEHCMRRRSGVCYRSAKRSKRKSVIRWWPPRVACHSAPSLSPTRVIRMRFWIGSKSRYRNFDTKS